MENRFHQRLSNRKMIMGKEDGDLDFSPFILSCIKYPFCVEAYNQGNSNHWLPQPIGMARDIAQWNDGISLTPDEKRVVEISLGYFTTADSIVANNLVLAIYRHITAPEARMFLLRQAFEETIHTQSYQYIVQSLGMDEEKIFMMYKNCKPIWNKDKLSISNMDNIFDPHFKLDSLDKAKMFLDNLVDFYVITEGIFFYASFAAIMSFQRRNLLPGTVEQFQYITRDESSHFQFGIGLIRTILGEYPELDTPEFRKSVKERILYAAELEELYAHEMAPRGILSFSASSYGTYMRHIADLRLRALGMDPVFNVSNPFPWMAEILDMSRQKNFFETRVTDYQLNGINPDEIFA